MGEPAMQAHVDVNRDTTRGASYVSVVSGVTFLPSRHVVLVHQQSDVPASDSSSVEPSFPPLTQRRTLRHHARRIQRCPGLSPGRGERWLKSPNCGGCEGRAGCSPRCDQRCLTSAHRAAGGPINPEPSTLPAGLGFPPVKA